MQVWRRYPWLSRGLVLLASAVVALAPGFFWPAGVAGIEDRVGDAYWQLSASTRTERRIVLVDIDERSLREVGPWPWPRATLASLVDEVRAAGAEVQVLDIVLAEARQDDPQLKASIGAAGPVIAQLFSLDPQVVPEVGQVVGGQDGGCDAFTPRAFGYYGLAPTLADARLLSGHITPRVDADGVIRHLPARICHEGRAHPALALAALWRAAKPWSGSGDPAHPEPSDWKLESDLEGRWLRPAAWLVSRSLPGVRVPIDTRGDFRVPYRLAREAFVSVSAADLLARSGPAREALRSSLVLVGATAFGMGDTVATPLSPVASGLEVHAQTLAGLIDGQLPYTPARWSAMQGLGFLVIAAVLLLGAASGRGAPAKRLPLMGIGLGATVVALAVLSLHLGQLWLPWFATALFVLLASVSLATVEHAIARAQRERLSAHLGAYLPATVAARLMASEPTGTLQFEPRQVSVLVSSVRNFNALATLGSPQELAALLHAYCCLAVEVVERHGGVVEHVVGDAITAVWNANNDCPDHPTQVVAATRELVASTATLFASRRPVAEDDLLQPLALGIGLESGAVLVGSYGPERRRAHTVLGESVSVALRLEQMTADLSVPILMGPQLASQLPENMVEPLGEYLLEGLGRPVAVATLVDWPELVTVDPQWALSATSDGESAVESQPWSRWGVRSRPTPWNSTRNVVAVSPGRHRA